MVKGMRRRPRKAARLMMVTARKPKPHTVDIYGENIHGVEKNCTAGS